MCTVAGYTLAKQLMSVSRIYLDSSTLIGNAWPAPGAELQKVLAMARFLGVAVFLPEIVEAECEAEWLRRLDQRSKQLAGALDALAQHTRLFLRPRIDLPSTADARADYRNRTAAVKEALGITTSTLTVRPLGDLIMNAAQHAFPFPTSDSGFRDAVILLSVADHVEATGEPILAFLVSDDNFFTGKGVTLSTRAEVKTFVKDLKGVDDALRQLYAEGIVREWTTDGQKLRTAIEHDTAGIVAFLTGNLAIPIGFSFFGLPSVKAVHGLTLKAVGEVSTSLAVPSERPSETIERISFRATVTAHETVESSPVRPTPTALRVGQEMPPPEPFQFQPPQVADVDVDLKVVVEADAHIVAGEYVGLTYVSVKIADRMVLPA